LEKKRNKSQYWVIEFALKAWTAHSNNNVHSVTKNVPNLCIHLTDSKEIEKIKESIKEYYKSKVKKSIIKLDYKVGTKVCIVKNVDKVKTKNVLREKASNLNKRPKDKTRIPAEVVDVSNLDLGFVMIQISATPLDHHLKTNEIYKISVRSLATISEKVWNVIKKDLGNFDETYLYLYVDDSNKNTF